MNQPERLPRAFIWKHIPRLRVQGINLIIVLQCLDQTSTQFHHIPVLLSLSVKEEFDGKLRSMKVQNLSDSLI